MEDDVIRRYFRPCALVLSLLLGSLAIAPTVRAQPNSDTTLPPTCHTSTSSVPGSNAKWMMCVPANWNGDLVVWAHGYTAFNQPLDFQNLQVGSIYLPTLVQSLGFAFATTSYPKNGLAILEGVDDVAALVNAFNSAYASTPPRSNDGAFHTYMAGASEGGIVTTLLIERHPDLFSGGLAACGPIGDFPAQLDYWGDYRVLFNYFFPGVIPVDPTNPIQIPSTVIDNWASTYQPAMTMAITSNPALAQQLIRVSHAPIDPANPTTTALSTTLDLMGYNVFATNDGIQELGGNPYDNTHRWYYGSSNDWKLNFSVQRFAAAPAAVAAMQQYQTSGNLTRPLVTIHTTGDDVIPFWHEILYWFKAHPTGQGRLTQIPIAAYGHCNFTAGQILGSFALLVYQVTGHAPTGIPAADIQAVRRIAKTR